MSREHDLFADQTGITTGVVKDQPAGLWNPTWKLDDTDETEEYREQQELEEQDQLNREYESQLYNE